MNSRRFSLGQWAFRTGVAVGAAALLVTGAAWRMSAATQPTATAAVQAAATTAPPIAHAIAGARDSYADIVKIVAPSVVTIHVEGKASVSPTQFQAPNDDFFRRFFGDPGDENGPSQRQPRSFRQRGLGSGVVVGN